MQIKAMIRYQHTPVRMVIKKILTIPGAGENAEQMELSHVASDNVKGVRWPGNQPDTFFQS